MFIINPFVGSWREFHRAFSQAARNLPFHSLGIIHGGASYPQYESIISFLPEFYSDREGFISYNSFFNKINIDEVINSLNKDGFSLGINLPKEIVQEIF